MNFRASWNCSVQSGILRQHLWDLLNDATLCQESLLEELEVERANNQHLRVRLNDTLAEDGGDAVVEENDENVFLFHAEFWATVEEQYEGKAIQNQKICVATLKATGRM